MGALIEEVEEGSFAEKIGIAKGDTLLAINGKEVKDVIEYQLLTSQKELKLEIKKKDGTFFSKKIKKEEAETLGIKFYEPVFDGVRKCRNRCLFCFVDQLPQGLRPSLYLKDDDYRYSFLYGNFITLTNLKREDVIRIKEEHLSPLYVSVHTTDPTLREKMMGNKKAGSSLALLAELTRARIELNTQIVLCPGLNDGKKLEETVNDLAGLGLKIKSIAVVPVGLTKYNRNNILPFTGKEAIRVLRQVEKLQKRFWRQRGSHLVYAADEFYLLAGKRTPPARFYEGFEQLENGVGMVSKFRFEFYQALRKKREGLVKPATIVTGKAAFNLIKELLFLLPYKERRKIKLVALPNYLFGSKVNVSGLLSGQDLLRLKGKVNKRLLIPENMLRQEKDLFLDDLTPIDIERELGEKVEIVGLNGESFLRALTANKTGELRCQNRR